MKEKKVDKKTNNKSEELKDKVEEILELKNDAEAEGFEEPQSSADTEKELAALKEEIEKLKDLNLRRAAEFENFKRRKERETEEFFKNANANLLKKLLPTLDNFERSLDSAQKDKDFDALVDGLELIFKTFKSTLSEEGLVEMDVVGKPFDPTYHEALMQVERDDFESHHVVDQHQKGYLIHDKILRPAQVVVNK